MIKRDLKDNFQISISGQDTWYDMNVPGSAMETFCKEGILPDPYYGMNEYKWTEFWKNDFDIRSTFSVSAEEIASEESLLTFYGIDTVADVFLNGKKLGHTENMHRTWVYQVKELVEEGKKGISADFNGVISKSAVQQGAAATQGMELFTLQNTDKVSVDINVSKYDYDKVKEGQNADITIGDRKYTGKVTKISHIATTNEKGSTLISATVGIDKPDKDIFLGVDAKVKIYAEKAEDVVTLPAGVVNIGKDGSFCYVLKDGVITKQDITTGISSEDSVEITDGIKAGDEVIEDLGSLEEGMKAEAAAADSDSAAETGETANE